MRIAAVLTSALLSAASALAAGAAGYAQQAPTQPPTIDREALRRAQDVALQRLQAPERIQAQPGQAQGPDFNSGAGYQLNADNQLWYGWVNFDQDRELGLLEGSDAQLAWREQAGGVRFAMGQREGARIVRCGTGSNSCALPQPDSPDALIAGAGSGFIRVDFAQPVVAVTALVAPDRSFGAEPDVFVMEGWSNGDIAASERAEMQIYDSPGEGWTRLTLSGLAPGRLSNEAAAAMTARAAASEGQEFDYVIIRALTANGAQTRTPIIMDALRFADAHGPTPYDSLGPRAGGMEAMLEDSRVRSERLRTVQRAEAMPERADSDDMRYKPAQRMRMPMDLDGARTASLRQRQLTGLELRPAAGLTGREPLNLPVLAPLGVFAGEDPSAGLAEGVRFTGRGDYFHLRFSSEIGRVVISGTRVVMLGQRDRQPGQLEVSSGYDGAYASLSLYGASYSVRVACGTEELDEPCNDPEALRTLLDRLFLWMPEGG